MLPFGHFVLLAVCFCCGNSPSAKEALFFFFSLSSLAHTLLTFHLSFPPSLSLSLSMSVGVIEKVIGWFLVKAKDSSRDSIVYRIKWEGVKDEIDEVTTRRSEGQERVCWRSGILIVSVCLFVCLCSPPVASLPTNSGGGTRDSRWAQ